MYIVRRLRTARCPLPFPIVVNGRRVPPSALVVPLGVVPELLLVLCLELLHEQLQPWHPGTR